MSYLSKIFIPFLIKLILVLLLTFSLVVEAQNKNTSYSKNTKNSNAFLSGHKNFESRFETRIYDLFKNNDIQGDFILGIVDETGLVYSYALNKAIIEKKPYSLNNDSPIYVASHTKAMTGTLLKILEEEGKVNLDKTLYDYLPELTFKGKVDTKSITVRSLLNHTHGIDSGIVVYKTAYFGYSGSTKELLDDFNKSSKIKTSKKFSYSNLGSVLAGMIVERVTGNTWKEEMKKRMFVPLGMTNTSANVSDYVDSDIRPIVTVSKDNQIVRSGFYKQDITMHAAGGILSTINDLSKWLQTNINQDNKIIKSAISWKALHEPTTTQDRVFFSYKRHGYSLGWDIATYQEEIILTRFGGYGGISFHLSFMPEKKIGIIAFTSNNKASSFPHLAANYAYNIINNNPNAEDAFKREEAPLLRAFDKSNNLSSILDNDVLELNDANDTFIGLYKNKDGWPDISITKNDSGYEIKWGVLPGVIYNVTKESRPYIASFDVLSRKMNIKKNRLFIGGLKYKKVE